jgi:nitrate reductase alpha subunit
MPKTPTPWQNRIVGHGEERPDQLLANPKNWRIHPKAQQDALAGVLDEVGWVAEVIVNRTTGHVVDGHLRVGIALSRNEPVIPVRYVDLTEAEEALVLATIDPISAMASVDKEQLASLLHDVESATPAISEMLTDLANRYGAISPEFESVGIDEQGRLDQKAAVICPNCSHEFVP